MDRLLSTLNTMTPPSPPPSSESAIPTIDPIIAAPQTVLLDFFFPGFSVFSTAVQKYLHIDLNLYIPLVLLCGGLTFAWQYFSEYLWSKVEEYLMSVVDIRTDDEIYNMLMSWVASQRFAQGARRFVVNTNLSSRSWFLYRWDDDDEDDDDTVPEGEEDYSGKKKKKALAYTPTFGSHWFWYKNRLLIFRRTQNTNNSGFLTASEKEEISISCFGRNPWVLKELLHEARAAYMRRDEAKTLIYRGTTRSGSSEPTWQRSMARTTRPFSTVILNEKVKKDLIDDVTDYLDPTTRRWYSNRGIPYRRGYLLHGPPGTGKSSLSLALAGFFKMRIYIVSLSSVAANEENLASLFAELPRRCVVLLEDIDSAGLTHTREDGSTEVVQADNSDMVPGQLTPGEGSSSSGSSKAPGATIVTQTNGRLSLSGLLNILDGVASQEGRVLIMTTNHVEKLDKALIRPGRVDMIVKFDKADTDMTAAIFRAIFAPLEGDEAPVKRIDEKYADLAQALEAERKEAAERERKKEETLARVEVLASQFAEKIPAHEFSPAEIQGFLLKHKRSPEAAVEGAEQWVLDARKEKKEKELKEAEEKRKKEEKEKNEKEEKEKKEKEEKEEEEEKKKKEERETKKSSKRKSKKSSRRKSKKESDSESSDSSSSDSGSESEASGAETKKRSKSGEKKDATTKSEAKSAAVVVEAPAGLKREASSRTVVAEEGKAKIQTDAAVEDGKQQGADSGYGTP